MYVYDTNNYLTEVTTPSGTSQVFYVIDPYNYYFIVQKLIDPLGNEHRFSFLPNVTYTDPRGNITKYKSSIQLGYNTKIIDALGRNTVFVYDTYGNLTSVTDLSGLTSTISYGNSPAKGNPAQITDPIGNTVTLAYDANDNLISIDAPLGRHTEFQYDSHRNLSKVINAQSKEFIFTYNSYGKITGISLPGSPRPSTSSPTTHMGEFNRRPILKETLLHMSTTILSGLPQRPMQTGTRRPSPMTPSVAHHKLAIPMET